MTDLVKYDAACRAVAEAKTTDEVIEIKNQAAALDAYARQAKNRDLEADAAEIRQRERRLGEMMEVQKKQFGTAQGRRSDLRPAETGSCKPTLAEAGISNRLADRARKAAAVPPERFEEIVQETRQEITSAAARADRKIADAAVVEPQAGWRDESNCSPG